MTRRMAAACAATITAFLAAGCSHQPTTPAYTHEQAKQMVERVIADEVENMSPKPRLQVLGGGDAPCAGPNDDKPTDLVMYEKTYWLCDIPKKNNLDILNQLKAYWSRAGYDATLDRAGTTNPGVTWTIAARNTATQFKSALYKSAGDELSIRAQSPCVPEDTSPPKPSQSGR